jgi:hypothetical protein
MEPAKVLVGGNENSYILDIGHRLAQRSCLTLRGLAAKKEDGHMPKPIKFKPSERLYVLDVKWTRKAGFSLTGVEPVSKLPPKIGIDTATNLATVGLRIDPKGGIEIVGLGNVMQSPVAKEGRCSL